MSFHRLLYGELQSLELFGKLQAQNKSLGLPVQILGDKVVTGEVEKIDDVFKAWEENLGVTPK